MVAVTSFVAVSIAFGIEKILGAFLAGTVFAMVFRNRTALARQLNGFSYGFLIPIFFINVGIEFPLEDRDDLEAVEGMLARFPQTLVVSEYFNFDRFGEIVLSSERRLTPTAEFEPGPDAIQAAQLNLLDRITLDDGRTSQNPDPAIHPNGAEFSLTNLFRGGDRLQEHAVRAG